MKIIKISILLFCFILVSFSYSQSDLKKVENYKAAKLEMDESIKSLELPIHSKIVLQESVDNIIFDISSADVNLQRNELAIVNPGRRSFSIHDYNTGSLLQFHKMDISYGDYVVDSGREPYDYVFREISYEDYKYFKHKDSEKYGLELSDTNLLKSYFSHLKFYNDTLVINSQMYVAAATLIDSNKNKYFKSANNIPMLIFYNKDYDIVKTIVPELKQAAHPVAECFEYNSKNGNYYLNTTSFNRFFELEKYDSLSTVMSYDSNGDQIESVHYMPESYAVNNVFYKQLHNPIFKLIDDELMILIPLDMNLWGVNNKKIFQLKNQPYSNDTGFIYYPLYEKYVQEFGLSMESDKIKERLFPVRIYDLFDLKNGNLGISYAIVDEEMPGDYYFLLQEYTKKAELINQTIIENQENGLIKNLTYDKTNNFLLVFKKGEVGWYMEKRKWE